MNPFTLSGPQFLVFYAVVCAAVLVALWYLQVSAEDGKPPRIYTSDPYLIAFANEVARVAVVSLIDRGLLLTPGVDSLVAKQAAKELVRKPVEKAVLDLFSTSGRATAIFTSTKC